MKQLFRRGLKRKCPKGNLKPLTQVAKSKPKAKAKCRTKKVAKKPSIRKAKAAKGKVEEVPKANITKVVPPSDIDFGSAPPYRPETYLVHFMQTNVFSRLDSNEKVALRTLLINNPEVLRLGTICSGTDGPSRLLDAFVSAASQSLNLPELKSTHMFSCEINSEKRNFISQCVEVNQIFGDVFFLAGPDAKGYDYKGCRVSSAPQVGGIVFGFPCQDGSALNPNRSQNRKVVAEGNGRTGTVFHLCLKHIKDHQPGFWFGLAENVLGLAHAQPGESSNHDQCMHMFESELEVFAKTFHVDPSINGVPIHRPRLYMPFFRRKLLTKWGIADEFADELLTKLVTRFSGRGDLPLETFLFDETDPTIVRYYNKLKFAALTKEQQAMAAVGVDQAPQPKKKVQKPKPKHDAFFKKLGHRAEDVRLPSEEMLVRWPGLRALCGRTAQILHHFGVEYPECKLRIIDVSQSLERLAQLPAASSSSIGPAHACTFHTNTQAYLTTRCRLLHPVEQFRLLGISYGDRDASLDKCSEQLLRDLAGNAMELTSCGIVLAACLVFLAICADQASTEKLVAEPLHGSSAIDALWE